MMPLDCSRLVISAGAHDQLAVAPRATLHIAAQVMEAARLNAAAVATTASLRWVRCPAIGLARDQHREGQTGGR